MYIFVYSVPDIKKMCLNFFNENTFYRNFNSNKKFKVISFYRDFNFGKKVITVIQIN